MEVRCWDKGNSYSASRSSSPAVTVCGDVLALSQHTVTITKQLYNFAVCLNLPTAGSQMMHIEMEPPQDACA